LLSSVMHGCLGASPPQIPHFAIVFHLLPLGIGFIRIPPHK
jgi:hypothetical protein